MAQRVRMHRLPRWLPVAVPAALIAIIASQPLTARAQAQANVSGVYVQSGGLFNYTFTVKNLGAFTLADVNFSVPTGINSVTNLSAPVGFLNVFDSSAGFIDFLADNNPATPQDFFAGTTVTGFRFSTPTLLTTRTFDAQDVQGNPASGPLQLTAAPEPGSLGFIAFAGVPFAAALASRRRRFAAALSLKG